jgi:hypothetical protein
LAYRGIAEEYPFNFFELTFPAREYRRTVEEYTFSVHAFRLTIRESNRTLQAPFVRTALTAAD